MRSDHCWSNGRGSKYVPLRNVTFAPGTSLPLHYLQSLAVDPSVIALGSRVYVGQLAAQGGGQPVVVVHDEMRLVGFHGAGGQTDAVEDEVRHTREQELVLGAGRLAFGAIGDDNGAT